MPSEVSQWCEWKKYGCRAVLFGLLHKFAQRLMWATMHTVPSQIGYGLVWAATFHLWSMELPTDKDLSVLNVWIARKLIEMVGFMHTYFSSAWEGQKCWRCMHMHHTCRSVVRDCSQFYSVEVVKMWHCDRSNYEGHVLIILRGWVGVGQRRSTFKWSNEVGWSGEK